MVRVNTAVASRKRRKRIRKKSKGFYGDRRGHLKQTKDALIAAMKFSTIHRKLKKREFRSLWIIRINTAARIHGLSYSKLINGLNLAKVVINRKILADLAVTDPKAFAKIAEQAKTALA